MLHIGRRAVYISAGLIGAVGSALMIVGSEREVFGLLLAGTILQVSGDAGAGVGVGGGCGVPPGKHHSAIGLEMLVMVLLVWVVATIGWFLLASTILQESGRAGASASVGVVDVN